MTPLPFNALGSLVVYKWPPTESHIKPYVPYDLQVGKWRFLGVIFSKTVLNQDSAFSSIHSDGTDIGMHVHTSLH